jgi:hypothetical protein
LLVLTAIPTSCRTCRKEEQINKERGAFMKLVFHNSRVIR